MSEPIAEPVETLPAELRARLPGDRPTATLPGMLPLRAKGTHWERTDTGHRVWVYACTTDGDLYRVRLHQWMAAAP